MTAKMAIGDVAADGWYCIGAKPDGSPLEMSPPVYLTWPDAHAGQDATKRLPNGGELSQAFNALTESGRALIAVVEGRIAGLEARGREPGDRIWGNERTGDVALCMKAEDGRLTKSYVGDLGETRYVR